MRRKSFTLVELLVVCIILGIVVVIAMPKLLDFYSSFKLRVFNTNISEIKVALENFKTESGIGAMSFYPSSLQDLENIMRKTPINPYTNKSMLTSTIEDAGIFYKSINNGSRYILVCTQQDINDIDRDNNDQEALSCGKDTNYNLLNNNWAYSNIALSGTTTLTISATNTTNYMQQIVNKQVVGAVLLFNVRAVGSTRIVVSLNDHTMIVPVSTEWQTYAIVNDKPANTIQVKFSDFPVRKDVYISGIVLLDK